LSRLLLTVHSAAPGGAQAMALAEAEHLSRCHELLIAVPRGPLQRAFAARGELIEPPPSLPLWAGASGRLWCRRMAATQAHAMKLRRLIRRRGVDAVVTNSTVSLSPVLAAHLARVPSFVHSRDTLESPATPLVRRLHARLATTVIAISRATAAPFEGARARVVQIHDGVAMPSVATGRTLGSPLRLTVVGAVDRNKGQDVAVRSAAMLIERGLDVTVDLVGPIPDPAFAGEVADLAGQLGLGSRLRWRGEVPDPDAAFAEADLVLVPSRGETLSLVAIEALARRLPLVASGVGGLLDVVRDGETGVLVPPGDARRFADGVAQIAADPRRADAMAARGREDVARRFDVRGSVEALRLEIERTLAEMGGPSGGAIR
jgi:glycosyltransferase involved in cell wall biosynthesis